MVTIEPVGCLLSTGRKPSCDVAARMFREAVSAWRDIA